MTLFEKVKVSGELGQLQFMEDALGLTVTRASDKTVSVKFPGTPKAIKLKGAIYEHDSNYGFNLPWWDRLCGTYRAQPDEGHRGMRLGLVNQPDAEHQSLPWFVSAPFKRIPPRD